ncbi:acyl-CoA Delta(11) desaturase-like [Thrips palmi]|uniref:Acyl-CoA Delta(11) desaturase-like n=1 Tax=Thrips palmi TaxID=161013 RepID=A0A6P8Y5T3_THRPL|nr:acyl-CoA Delta(11) desaturase-like [Thrips palmi]XP_034231871.1 acyl-CoA Delta(11) desaturase-like [Thrips palmi]
MHSRMAAEVRQPDHLVLKKKNNPWFETDIVWINVFLLGLAHLVALYALPRFVLFQVKWQTWIFSVILYYLSTVGSNAGAHRLFSHRAFKATLPLKVFLLAMGSLSFQPCAWSWARDHRVHHKHSDTMADPYSAGRGFFFAHHGWALLRRHPEVLAKYKTVDMSDLENDPYVMFQRRHQYKLILLFAVALPLITAVYGWNETWLNSFLVPVTLRVVWCLNCTAMINSWSHHFGTKPYDKTIYPVQSSLVAHLALGEGWHNYHHAFPWDYKASELGLQYNPMATFIKACARLGLAYDLKEASSDVIKARIARTGDGTPPLA